MDQFKYQYPNNKIRIVGKLLSAPEEYYVSPYGKQYYRFLVETKDKWNNATIVPVVTKNKRCENLNIVGLVGKNVVIRGSANSRADVRHDDFGNTVHFFDQFIKLEDIREAVKDYRFENIGAIQGVVLKKIDRTLRKTGKLSKNIILRVEHDHYKSNIEVYTRHLFDSFNTIEPGDEVGFKYRFVNTSKQFIKPKLEAVEIYRGKHVVENPRFQSLVFHTHEDLDFFR